MHMYLVGSHGHSLRAAQPDQGWNCSCSRRPRYIIWDPFLLTWVLVKFTLSLTRGCSEKYSTLNRTSGHMPKHTAAIAQWNQSPNTSHTSLHGDQRTAICRLDHEVIVTILNGANKLQVRDAMSTAWCSRHLSGAASSNFSYVLLQIKKYMHFLSWWPWTG